MRIVERPRRLRQSGPMRRLVRENRLHAADLVLPMFVREGITEPAPISSMPGVYHHTLTSLVEAARDAVEAGVGGLMLFGVPTERDAVGSGADDPDGILNKGLDVLVREFGDDVVVMADLCLDEFTDHGHCGVLDSDGRIDNDATLERYADMALAQAAVGTHVLGLSGMMDGQVGYVREVLDAHGYTDVAVLAYAAKYASTFYGPFREAVDSQLVGDRRTYQQDAGNGREALREVRLDLGEGADIVMVKPGMPYLDVLADVAGAVDVPVFTYQISGEYAMIEIAAEHGAIDRDAAIEESLLAFKRAGADGILTYWATEVARKI